MFGRTMKTSYHKFMGSIIKMTIALKTIKNCTRNAFCPI